MKDAAITNIYFDSSLLVKLYHPEPGSREAAQLASCHRSISLSFIAAKLAKAAGLEVEFLEIPL